MTTDKSTLQEGKHLGQGEERRGEITVRIRGAGLLYICTCVENVEEGSTSFSQFPELFSSRD